MNTYQLSLKDKSRVVIPAKLREEAGLSDAQNLVATPLAEGGFVVRSRDQVLANLWAKLPKSSQGDLVAEYIEESAAAHSVRRRELDNPPMAPESEWATRESVALAKLGL